MCRMPLRSFPSGARSRRTFRPRSSRMIGGSYWSCKAALRGPVGQHQDARFFCAVFERAEIADFLEPAQAIGRVEKAGVVRGQLGRFQVAAAQILVAKRDGILRLEKMKTQPAAIGAG